MEKELCPSCEKFEIYSETLTNGLCLNCYHMQQEEDRAMAIEWEYDYENGLL